ncbi:MAG: VacJ family lipoprotein [Legionellaceae bacterium]|nr:VacJ family lipoprotein [Legionellaceae bacterium]
MAVKTLCITLLSALLLGGCFKRGSNPQDPYEYINRQTDKFNVAFDATVLKPPARFYKAVLPAPVRMGIDNFYSNLHMLPTTANDLLQAEWKQAIRDTWRFAINSTLGIGGILDVATGFGLPKHTNDMGLTFAKWGDKQSPYLVLPLLGPSTIRDAIGLTFDYALFMPYPYLNNDALLYSLLGLRYIDIRSQFLDTEKLMAEALDPYAFVRDAYLQNRNYAIQGESAEAMGSLYVEEAEVGDYIDDEPHETDNPTTSHAAHRPVST